MTDRDSPVPGQGPEAWRSGNPGAPDLLELQATDALLDRIALRLPTRDDLDDPLAAAFVALAAEVDTGLAAERRDGRGLNGSANGRRTNGHANGHGTTNGHTFGYADLRPGLNGHRPDGLNGVGNGPFDGSLNGHANGRHRDDFDVSGYEIVGDGGELRPRPQRPVSLAGWRDRVVDLATRKPLAVLGAAAATVGIMFGAVLLGQNFTPLPDTVGPGSPSVSETQLAGINSALTRADTAVDQGQVASARKALDEAETAVEQLPQSAQKETYRNKIEKLRIKVDRTKMPSVVTGGPGVVTTPVSTVTTSPAKVTTSPTTVSGSVTVTTSPTGSPTTASITTTTTQVAPVGSLTPDPTETTTESGVTPDSSGELPVSTTAP